VFFCLYEVPILETLRTYMESSISHSTCWEINGCSVCFTYKAIIWIAKSVYVPTNGRSVEHTRREVGALTSLHINPCYPAAGALRPYRCAVWGRYQESPTLLCNWGRVWMNLLSSLHFTVLCCWPLKPKCTSRTQAGIRYVTTAV
jgi:hypothetical protein